MTECLYNMTIYVSKISALHFVLGEPYEICEKISVTINEKEGEVMVKEKPKLIKNQKEK